MGGCVTFLLGAGFSAPFGIPTMRPFLEAFRSTAMQKYSELGWALEKHYRELTNEGDLEDLLSSLGKAERLLEAAPPGVNIPDEFTKWQEQSRYLKAHLISYIIERCERFDRGSAQRVLGPGIETMVQRNLVNDVHFFTTNYDRIVEDVCERSGIDFEDGFGGGGREVVAPSSVPGITPIDSTGYGELH